MADILSSAQTTTTPTDTHVQAIDPVVSDHQVAPTSPDENKPMLDAPPLPIPDLPFSQRESAQVKNTQPAVAPPPNTEEVIPMVKSPSPRRVNIGAAMSVLMLLLVTLPLIIFYTTQKRELADVRSRADECESGPSHEYNECCAPGKSRHVVRECSGGQFTWNTGDCSQDDGACGAPSSGGGSQPSCAAGEVFADGQCHNIQGCSPSCSGKGCGEPDGCSGVCTEACSNQQEANQASNAGPQPQAEGGIINSGISSSDACTNSGTCSASSGQTMQVCSCTGLEYGTTTAICTQNCVNRTGSVNCQNEANSTCKVIQIDVLNSSGLVDTIVCTPDTSQCGSTTTTTNPSTSTSTSTTTTTTTGATGTPTSTPIPTSTPTPGPTCETIRVYDAAMTDITAQLKDGSKKLAIGEEVTIATSKGTATKARFRIQGVADWAEHDTAKTTSTEYRLTIRIPAALTQTQGTFEVEVFMSGVWK